MSKIKPIHEPVKNGLIEVTFRFNGVVYRRTHQLAGNEMKAMKMILESEGEKAQEAIIWKATFWGINKLGQGVIKDAVRGFLKSIDYKAPVVTDEIKASQEAAFNEEVLEASKAFLESYAVPAGRVVEKPTDLADTKAVATIQYMDYAEIEQRIASMMTPSELRAFKDNMPPTNLENPNEV